MVLGGRLMMFWLRSLTAAPPAKISPLEGILTPPFPYLFRTGREYFG
jgi:hypothetical protein